MMHLYEIHVTVDSSVDKEYFRAVCRSLGVKPLVLELLSRTRKTVMMDVMTSSKVYAASLEAAQGEMKQIAIALERSGIPVIREKIETTPWNNITPKYLECHLNVVCEDREKFEEVLVPVALANNGYISRNTAKPGVYMLTLRAYHMPKEHFDSIIHGVKPGLTYYGMSVSCDNIEVAVYDTFVEHDKVWLQAA